MPAAPHSPGLQASRLLPLPLLLVLPLCRISLLSPSLRFPPVFLRAPRPARRAPTSPGAGGASEAATNGLTRGSSRRRGARQRGRWGLVGAETTPATKCPARGGPPASVRDGPPRPGGRGDRTVGRLLPGLRAPALGEPEALSPLKELNPGGWMLPWGRLAVSGWRAGRGVTWLPAPRLPRRPRGTSGPVCTWGGMRAASPGSRVCGRHGGLGPGSGAWGRPRLPSPASLLVVLVGAELARPRARRQKWQEAKPREEDAGRQRRWLFSF